jgi:choline monooxygenase
VSSASGLAVSHAGASAKLVGRMEEFARKTAQPIDQAKCLHASFYTDDAYHKLEWDTIFGTQWLFVAHTAEISKPGDVKVVDMGTSSMLITRDGKNKIHAFHNACRHRGARICSESRSNCKQLVCPYHWWVYRLDGSLKASPPTALPSNKKDELGLIQLPGVEIFAGMVFVNRSPNPPPLLESLGDLPDMLARYDLDAVEVHGAKVYDLKCNWKSVAENFLDFYHLPPVHPLLSEYLKLDDHKPYQRKGQYVGYVVTDTGFNDDGGPGDISNFNTFPGITKSETNSTLFFTIFPNVNLTVMPHAAYTLASFPTDVPGKTREVLTLLLPKDARKADDTDEQFEAKRKALLDFVIQLNDEDVIAMENLHEGLVNLSREPVQGEYMVKYDWTIHRFQNLVLSGLRDEHIDESFMPEYDQGFPMRVAVESGL